MKKYELLEVVAWSDDPLEDDDSAFEYAYNNGEVCTTLAVYETLESGMSALKKCKNLIEYRSCGDGSMLYEIFSYGLQEVFYDDSGDIWEGELYYGVA